MAPPWPAWQLSHDQLGPHARWLSCLWQGITSVPACCWPFGSGNVESMTRPAHRCMAPHSSAPADATSDVGKAPQAGKVPHEAPVALVPCRDAIAAGSNCAHSCMHRTAAQAKHSALRRGHAQNFGCSLKLEVGHQLGRCLVPLGSGELESPGGNGISTTAAACCQAFGPAQST